MEIKLRIFNNDELMRIHEDSLSILENPGMKILGSKMLEALKLKGAKVDSVNNIVSFPKKLVNETIEIMQKDIKEGRTPKFMNGVTCEKTDSAEIQAKFGGACIQYLGPDEKEFRTPSEEDLINMVKLGQFLPEVKTVGNPVTYLKDRNGNLIEPRMQRVKTAALVAKYTTKPGPTEVWNVKELEYLMELGILLRGSLEEYLVNPCFITAKETIAPLILEKNACEVLLALAENNLPCTIIPMPISGISSPVELYSNVLIGNAEILGTAVCIKAIYPEAKIVGGAISGSINMATGTANFATPEATLQDIGMAELHEEIYGFNFGVAGYFDAKYPGIQNAIEKTLKYLLLSFTGRFTYPVGLVNWSKCFSPAQALIDLQIIKEIHKFLEGIRVPNDSSEILELIRSVGAGGSFLQESHTLHNYKKNLMMPEFFDHTLSQGIENDRKKDILVKVSERAKAILKKDDLYEIDSSRSKEIDKIVEHADRNL